MSNKIEDMQKKQTDECLYHRLNEGYTYYIAHPRSRPYDYLLVKLDNNLLPTLQRFYCIFCYNKLVNNYELSEWEGFYLELWSLNNEELYITSDCLLSKLNLQEIPMCHLYFKSIILTTLFIDGRVFISHFIEFLCTFSFYPIEDLVPCINYQHYLSIYIVILTICGVKSNRIISEAQIRSVLIYLHVPIKYSKNLEQWLPTIEHDEDGNINLSELVDHLLTQGYLSQTLLYIRRQLIDVIIGDYKYKQIYKRFNYYESLCIVDAEASTISHNIRKDIVPANNIDNTTPIPVVPKEQCLFKCVRQFILKYPPDFYYNYFPDKNVNKNEGIVLIRKRFGYSSRPNTMSSLKLVKFSKQASMNKKMKSVSPSTPHT